jgi:hypothetical protein
MKKRIILGIGLLLILLPIISPASNTTNAAVDDSNDNPQFEALQAGSKYVYDITTFDYGAGFLEILDLILPVEAPDFDYGFVGSFVGSEIMAYITAVDSLPLYQYDYWYDYTYENMTMQNAFQMFTYLKLNSDLMAYLNASMFTFPDDFADTNITNYFNYWAHGDFEDTVDSDEFWSGFNTSFEEYFVEGFNACNYSWGHWPYEWPHDDWYGESDIYWFAWDLGRSIGYDIGYWVCDYSSHNLAWNDSLTALNGFYDGFFDGRLTGFTAGEADYLSTYRIPDERPPTTPTPVTLYDYAFYQYWQNWYHMYYSEGYLYQGAFEYFNRKLYHDLYDSEWNTWMAGYVEGYANYYWDGWSDGDYDRSWSNPYYTSYWPPWPYEPYNARDEGYNQGMQDGYDAGYDDGFYMTNDGEQYLSGMHGYQYDGYHNGFQDGAADSIASNPESPFVTLPFPTPTSPYEDGANYAYENQFYEGYHNGYLYATLVNSPDPKMWLWSNGPFYTMNLPDAELDISAGSVIPIAYPLTMFRDLEFASTELMDGDYEFWWDSGYDYWPFTNGGFVPMQSICASDTNWVTMDDFDVAMNETSGSPGFNTTYDPANNYFLFELHMNLTEPGMTQDVYWGYNTTDGMLLNISMDLNFYTLSDMWVDMVIELNYGKEEVVTFTDLTSDSWTYYIDDFVFYYDVPPVAPTEFVNGLTEFKTNGLNSIGNDFLTVTVDRYEGLWANFSMELMNPANPAEPPAIGRYSYPMIYPAGWQFLPDWSLIDGMFTTVTSVIGNLDYFVGALGVLAGQNSNVILNNLVLDPVLGQYYYATQDVQYLYLSIDAAVDFEFGMLNGEYVWETSSLDGWIKGYIWVGIDYTTGQVLGGGVKASFDFVIGQTPDYGMDGMGLEAYLEIIIGSDLASIPHLDAVIGGLPVVSEYSLVTILSIIGLAAISSAVIFTKRRK